MKLRRLVTPCRRVLILGGSVAAILTCFSRAANQNWDGGSLVDGIWSTAANWLGDPTAPGSTSSTTNTDVATFNTAIVNTWGSSVGNPIVIDAGRDIGGINFDLGAGNYFVGSTGGNTLKVSSGGSIQILNTLAATNAVQTINAPLQIQGANGAYTFANNSANGGGVGAGTLNFGGGITGGASGATVLTLGGSNTNANTINGAITNGGATSLALTKIGAGTWVLAGPNNYSGPTTLNQGTLNVNSSAALGDGSATNTLIFNGGTLQAGGTVSSPSTRSVTLTSTGVIDTNGNSVSIAGVMSGPGGLTKMGSGTLSLAGINTYAGATTISSGTLKLENSSTTISGFGVDGTGWTNNGGATITGNVLTLTDNLGSEARSSFLNTRVGTGAFTSSFIYTAGGSRAADGVAFVLQNDIRGLNALGTNGGSLGYGANGGTPISPSAAVEFNIYTGATGGVGTRYATNGVTAGYTANTPVNLASGDPIQVNLSYDGSNFLTLQLTDNVTGNTYSITYTVGSLAATTGGSTAYVGFTGGTGGSTASQTISNFVLTNNLTFNVLPITTAVTMASGTTFDINGTIQQIASLADATVGGTSGHQVLLGNGALIVGDATSTVFSGSISGTGSFTKVGSGVLTLSGVNTYTGTTTIGASGGASGGTLRLSGAGTISNSVTTVFAGTLDLNGTTQTITGLTLGGGAPGTASSVAIGSGQLNLGGDVIYLGSPSTNGATISGSTGKLTLGANRIFNVGDSPAAVVDLTVSASIQDNSTVGGAARSITKLSPGTLLLSEANTYTGTTTIGVSNGASGGTLQLGGAGTISNAAVTVFGGTLDLNGTSQTISTLSLGGGASGTTAAVVIGAGQLNLGGDVTYVAANNPFGATISSTVGLLTLGGNRSFNVGGSTAAAVDLKVSAIIRDNSTVGGAARSINVLGGGTLLLSGANSYTGGTTVSSGTLVAGNASALGTGSVVVSANSALNYGATSNATLAIGGTLSITGGTSTAIGGSLGATASSAAINVTGAASATGAIKVNVFSINGVTPLAGTNTYTLVHGGVGSSLNGATYAVGTIYNNTNFTVGAPSATATDLTIPVTSATPLATAYWAGGLTGATNVWAASNGSTQSNWVAISGGANQALVPGAGADLIFSNSTVTTSPNGTTLGADMTIKSLTQQDTSNPVTLNADGYKLTITPAAATTGITLSGSVQNVTISAEVVLGAAQTWANNSSFASLTINGNVSNGANLLTVGGSRDTTMNGVIGNGSGGLTKTGGGTLTLSGANTFSGPLSILQGTLSIPTINDANTAGVLGNSASAVPLGNTGGVTGTLTYTGSSGSSTRPFTMATGGTGVFNVNSGAVLTLSGVIDGSGNFTKSGSGTLVLSGAASNTYNGLTTVSTGALFLGKSGTANAIAGGGLTISNGAQVQYTGNSTDMMGTGAVTINGSGQLDFNGDTDTIGNVTILANGAGANTSSLKNTAGGGNLTIGTLGITPVAGLTSVISTGTGGTLTLGGTVTFTAATTGQAQITGSTLALGGDRIFNVGLGAGLNYELAISSAISGSGNGLTKQGAGRLLLSGANSYTGATNISVGTVIATNASAFNPTSGGAVSVAAGATLNYFPTVDAPLALHSTLTITGGAGTTIGSSLGATTSSAAINVTGAAAATGAVTVNVFPVNGVTPLAGTNTYTLIHGGAGSSLNGATYTLGVYNNTNFSVGALSVTATDLTIPVTSATPLTTAYWKGGLSGATNVWAASNGSTQSNWVATLGGANQALVPGAGADLSFSNSTVTTAPTSTVLGADMTIKSLTVADTVNGLGVNADGSTLTLGVGGLTVNAAVPTSTIAAKVALGGNQIWTNNSANGLTVSGVVSGNGNLTKAGVGTLTLSGANTFSGLLNVQQGTLSIATINDAGTIGVLGSNAGAVSLGNTGGVTGTLSYTGSGASSTRPFTIATGGTGEFNVVSAAGTLTLNGLIDGSGNLTKTGTGTLSLVGTNTFSGLLSVPQGTLSIATINDASTAGVLGNSASAVLLGSTGGVTGTLSYTGGGGNVSSSRPFTMATGGTGAFSVSFNTLTLSGLIDGSGNLTKTGGGTLSLSGANTFGGLLSVQQGTLSIATINDANTVGVLGNSASAVSLGNTGGSTGTLFYTGGTASSTKPFTMATGGTGTFSVNTASTTLTLSGLINGSGNFAKTGAGTLVLSVADNYTGTTNVSAGTLSLTGSLTGGTAITVSSTGVFSESATGVISGTASFTHSSTGKSTLSGANSYTGATSISAGTVLVTNASALNPTTGGAVSVAAGATLNYSAAVDAPLGLHSTLTITGGTGTAIGGSLGGSASSAAINATGAATATGAVTVNVFSINGVTPLAGTNTYSLVHGGAGSSLNGATYALGTVYNNSNFTVGLPSATATNNLTIPVTSATPLSTAYWIGGLTGATNVWAVSNGSTQSNWVATSGGASQALVPGAGADLIFSNSTVTTSPNGTTLGADMTIKSLTQQDTANSVTLNADGYKLTITPAVATAGITISSSNAQSVTINANVVLGAAQTWTNNSNFGSFTVNGNVSNGANLLTVAGSNGITITGVLGNGSGGVTKTGAGTLTLSGANTFIGPLSIQQGTLSIAAFNDASTFGVLGNSAGAVSLGNTGGVTGTLSYTGSTTSSTKPFTMATGGTGAFSVNNGVVLTLSGVIDGGGNLNKTNSGTLVFSGATSNTYSGLTTVSTGTLLLGKSGTANAIAGGGLTINSGTQVQYTGNSTDMMGAGTVTINGSGQLDFNGATDTIGNVTISGSFAATTPLKNTAGGGNLTIGTLGITPVSGFTSAISAGSGGTLTLGGTVTFTAATTGQAQITGTTLALGGDRTFNVDLGSGAGYDLAISSVISGSGNGLTKQGAGRLLLSAANSYTGATNISAGTVTVTSASAFNPTSGGAVSIAAGATLNYFATVDAPLGLHSTLTITGGAGTTIGGLLGATPTSAEINVTGAASATGAVTVNLVPLGPVTPGAYTLIHGGAGSSLNGATYALGTIYGNTDYTITTPTATATDLTIPVVSATPLTTAYWKGGFAGATNVWAISNGSSNSNWSATAGGAVQGLVPGAGTDVIFSATSPAIAPSATLLGASMTIQSLTIADTSYGLGLNADGNTLTLGTGGLTMNAAVPTSTIAVPLTLGANQTWTNNSFGTLVMNGVVSGAANLVKAGIGTLTLSGSNSFTGSITINGGVLLVTADGNLGDTANAVTLGAGGSLRFNNATTLATTRVINVTGSPLNPGGLTFGPGVVQILGASQLTGSGAAQVSVTAGTGIGTLVIDGANAGFTGNLTVGAPGQMVGTFFSSLLFSNTDGATLRLQNAGTLPNVANLTLNNGSALTITQPTTAVTGRLGSSMPLTFHSGRFQYNPSVNGGLAINENFGNVTTDGLLVFTGGTAGPVAGTTLNFGTLTRNDHATLALRSNTTLGTGSIGGGLSTGVGYYFSGMVDSGGTPGTPSRGVVPWAAAFSSTSGSQFNNLVTYDANGFRQLTSSEVTPVTSQTLWDATVAASPAQNADLQTTVTVSGTSTINALLDSTGLGTLNGTGTLVNNSGAVANLNALTFNGPTLSFPNGGYFHLGLNVTVTGTSVISGAGGVTVSALNPSNAVQFRLTNTVANTFTGGLFINGNGQVTFSANNQLGQTGGGLNAGDVILGGGQLLFSPAIASTASLNDGASNRPIFVNASKGTIGTIVTAAVLQIPGTISGVGQVQFGGGALSNSAGIVELTNTAANTYSGGTLISSGTLRLSNANQLGTGPILFNGGTLQPTANLIFASAPTLVVTSTIDTQANDITLTGGFTGSGGLTKIGTGRLFLASANTYTGITSVTSGALAETSSGSIADTSLLVVNGATAVFDLGANHSDTVGSVTMAGGGTITGTGTSSLIGNAGQTFTLQSGSVNAILAGGAALNKTSTGSVTLSAANTYTGATTIGQGKLIVTNGAGLNPTTGGAVSIAGGTLNYVAAVDAQLVLGSTLTITGGAGTGIGVSLGSTATSSEINVTGAATATGIVAVNLNRVGGVTPGTYALLHGGAGSSLNGATYFVNNASNFNAVFTATTTDLQVAISSATPLTTAYWKGGFAGGANVWAVSDGSSASNWMTTANGAVQALVPGAGTDVIISGNSPATAPTAAILGADMAIRSLTIADTINGLGLNADGNTLTLGAGGLTMNVTVPTSAIAAPMALSGNQTWTNNSFATLTINSVVSGNANLVKAGIGTLTLGGANSFTGGITINGGVVSIAADGNLGNTTNALTLGAGGTLRFSGATTLAATRVITVTGSQANPGGISLGNGVTQILGAGQFTGSGAAQVSLTGGTTTGILSVEGDNTGFTGNLTVGAPGQLIGTFFSSRIFSNSDGATLRLQNAGTLPNVANLTVNNGSALTITQPTTAVTGRLGNGMPLTFHSGRFQYNPSANGGLAINDSFGNVTADGLLVFTGGTAGPASGTTLSFGTLTRNDHATLGLRSNTVLGTGSIGGGSNTGVRYFLSGMVDSGGTAGAPSRGVVPWAAAFSSTSGSQFNNLVTYDANGFRQLTSSEVTPVTSQTLWDATVAASPAQNADLQTTVTVSGTSTLNALINSTGTPTFNGTGTLVNNSGAVANFGTLTVNGPTLSFPNGGYFHLGLTVAISGTSLISGAGGVTTSALNPSNLLQLRLTNTVANTFTGGLFINGNSGVTFTANNQLGQTGGGLNAGDVTLGGGQLLFSPATAVTVSLNDGASNRGIFVNASNGTIGTTIAGAVLQIPGAISGVGQVQFGGGATSSATGVVELTNPAANTYSGGTLISSGILRLSNANQLGTGPILFNGGTLQPTANLIFASAPTLVANSTIDTQANDITITSGFTGSSGLTKSGSGKLLLTGANTYTGTTSITNGALIVSGSLAGSVSIAAGATPGTLASGNNLTAQLAALNAASDASGAGVVSPGSTGGSGLTSVGRLTANGNVALGSGAFGSTLGKVQLQLEIGGTAPGTQYDQLQLTGGSSALALNNVNLVLSAANSFNPTSLTIATFNTGTNQLNLDGSTFFLVIGSTAAVTGTFANQQAPDVKLIAFNTVTYGGQLFAISYAANSVAGTFTGGNDVAIMAIPEPGTATLLLAGLQFLGLRRRRRREGSRTT